MIEKYIKEEATKLVSAKITKEQYDFIKENNINLSLFIREKIKELIEKSK